MRKQDEILLRFKCPYCDAWRGDWCFVRTTNARAGVLHMHRYAVAAAHGLVPPVYDQRLNRSGMTPREPAAAERDSSATSTTATSGAAGTDHTCPECANGKCGNCDGVAWDFAADQPTRCECDHGAEPGRDEEAET